MSKEITFHLRDAQQLLRTYLPLVERSFNSAGYLPVVHRVSGGARIVFWTTEVVGIVALFILIQGYGQMQEDIELQREGWKILDFAVHGLANIFRGFVESHRGFHLLCPLYDYFVQAENSHGGLPSVGLSYSHPIFRG